VGRGAGGESRLHDAAENLVQVLENLPIGDAQDPKAAGSQVSIPVLVVVPLPRLLVDLAIQLHHELMLVTIEVEDIGGKGDLAPELETCQAAIP
jgi:hypothetical protein